MLFIYTLCLVKILIHVSRKDDCKRNRKKDENAVQHLDFAALNAAALYYQPKRGKTNKKTQNIHRTQTRTKPSKNSKRAVLHTARTQT